MSQSREIATLGDGKVFVKRTDEGQMCAVKSEIELSLGDKELCSVGGSVMVTASGLDKLNRVAGLTVIKPPQINITVERRGYPETTMVENPYIEYSEDGAIKVVTVECSAIGLSPIGNWVITQERLRFDLVQYFAADAWNKVKRYPDCGRFTTKAMHDKSDDGKMWIPIMMNTGLSVDVGHPEIVSVLTAHITRQKFAERIASTICRRNAMKRHPAIAQSVVIPQGGYARVPVIGWQHDQTAENLKAMAAQTAAGVDMPKEIKVVKSETEVEFGDKDNAGVEDDLSSDDMDPGNKSTDEDQPSMLDQGTSLEDREKHLLYLGKVRDSLGDKFKRQVWAISPRISECEDFSKLPDEDLETLTVEFKERARKQKEKE